MPAELQTLLDDLEAKWQTFWNNNFTDFSNYFGTLGDYILANNWVGAHDMCDLLKYQFNNPFRNGLASSSTGVRYRLKLVLQWMNDNWGAGGVTLDDILNAMLTASFEQLQQFIGITEAYKIALWNAPFNADMYAALGRGFVKWPQY